VKIVIVAPSSPRWSTIGSVRWEKLAKYLSKKHSVYFVTSCFPDKQSFRSFDLGQAHFVEIPLKYFKRAPQLRTSNTPKVAKRKMLSNLARKMKAEFRPFLELFLPVSPGGILFHDYEAYINELNKIISNSERTILFTTYGPWFSLKLGALFKRQYGERVVWIADFRDPSFNIPESIVSRLPVFKHATKKILTMVDGVLVVTKKMVKDYEEIVGSKVFFLPNGYDEKVFLESWVESSSESLRIVYTGSFHPRMVELTPFILGLLNLKEREKNVYSRLRFVYAGKDYNYVQQLFRKFSLVDILDNRGFIPRDEALRVQAEADILLLIAYTGNDSQEGSAIRTGKVYEYLATGKPILAIAPKNWEMREEIEGDGVSKVFDKSEPQEMAEYIAWFFTERKQVNLKRREEVISPYFYENLSKRLEEIIRTIS